VFVPLVDFLAATGCRLCALLLLPSIGSFLRLSLFERAMLIGGRETMLLVECHYGVRKVKFRVGALATWPHFNESLLGQCAHKLFNALSYTLHYHKHYQKSYAFSIPLINLLNCHCIMAPKKLHALSTNVNTKRERDRRAKKTGWDKKLMKAKRNDDAAIDYQKKITKKSKEFENAIPEEQAALIAAAKERAIQKR
jgi:hypothetical protein